MPIFMKEMSREEQRKFAIVSEIANTISGGMSETTAHFSKSETVCKVEVTIPGINVDDVNVEIHDRVLTIFFMMELESGELVVHLPRMIYHRLLLSNVDIEKVEAKSTNNKLVVTLPLNDEDKPGYHRKVSIDK